MIGTKENAKSKSVVLFVPANEEERARHSGKPLSLSGGRTIPCVESAVYLGHTITSTLSDTPHLRLRASKAAQAFGAPGRNLMRSNHAWKKVKKMVFESMILPTLLDGIECCVVTQQALDELTTVYHRMVRASLYVSPHTQRKWKLASEVLLERLDLHPLHHYVDMKILGCAGHVERMGPDRRPKRLRDGALDGPKMPGGQHKTHHQTVEECIGRKGMSEWRKLAATKTEWRKAIRTSILLRARTSVKPQTKFIDRWAEAPDSIIGRSVEKKFGSKWHVGKIVSTELDIDTNETIWHVKHDDSDSEDFCAREIEVAMLDTDDEGSSSGEGASSTAIPPSPNQSLRELLSPKFNAKHQNPTDTL
jgi:hypothetical protein